MKYTEKQIKYSAYTIGAIVSVGGFALALAGGKKLKDLKGKKDAVYGMLMVGVGAVLTAGGAMFILTMHKEFSE